MPLREERRDPMIPQGHHAPQLIDEPVRPGPAPEEQPPPMGEGMEPPMSPEELTMGGMGEEEGLPTTATVAQVSGDEAILVDEAGQKLRVPVEAFPFEPMEGMELSRAVVTEVTEDSIVVLVGEEQTVSEIPSRGLQTDFNVGDYFWMPAPPASPEMMDPTLDPVMEDIEEQL